VSFLGNTVISEGKQLVVTNKFRGSVLENASEKILGNYGWRCIYK